MFKALIAVQWKSTKVAALLATLLGFGIPIWSARQLLSGERYATAPYVVAVMEVFGIGYAILAAGTGLAFALIAWAQDHRGRHVYALSLPVARSKYAGMRFGAGMLFLLLPTLGVLIGSLVAIAIAPIPPGMHAYPIALTLRFLFSSAVAFSIFFAIGASTPKAAGIVLGAVASVFLVAFVLAVASAKFDLLPYLGGFLFMEPGLLSVFTGRWMLFDA
jgi:hypothetical protein